MLLPCAVVLVIVACVVPAHGACTLDHCVNCMTNTDNMCSNCENGYMLSDNYTCETTDADDSSGDGTARPWSLSSIATALLLLLGLLMQ